MAKNFEHLDVFQNALDLSVAIYKATASFPDHERYGLTAQLRRAVISVISNIAEGQGRLTRGEWRQFLGNARGSLFEIQAQLLVASGWASSMARPIGHCDRRSFAPQRLSQA